MSRQILHGQFRTAFRLRRGPRCSHQYQCDAAVSRSLFGHFPWRTRPKVDGISRRHRVRLLLVDCILGKAKSLMVHFELLPLYLCVIESTNAMLRLLAMVSLTTDSSLSGVDATEIWYDAGSGGRWECFLSYDPKYWTFGHLIFNDEPWAWFGEICSYTSLIYQVEINFIESRSSLTQQWKWEFGNNQQPYRLYFGKTLAQPTRVALSSSRANLCGTNPERSPIQTGSLWSAHLTWRPPTKHWTAKKDRNSQARQMRSWAWNRFRYSKGPRCTLQSQGWLMNKRKLSRGSFWIVTGYGTTPKNACNLKVWDLTFNILRKSKMSRTPYLKKVKKGKWRKARIFRKTSLYISLSR